MKEKIVVGLVSAIVSGAASVGWSAATTSGRLTEIERSIARIEQRLDRLADVPRPAKP